VSRFGVPAVITSDRGAQFTSSLWAALCSLLNIQQHNQTTAYHPQSNGMVARFHRCLKDALRARSTTTNWVDHLPWVRGAAAREDNGSTPAQAVFGSPLILPGQFLDSPELPSKIFLEQFSKTLSAAEHTARRHYTTAARRPPTAAAAARRPCPRSDGVCEAGRTRTTTPAAVRQPLHRPSPLYTTSRCASATRRTRCPPSDSSPAPTPQRRLRSPGSGVAHPPPSASGIFPRQGPRRPAGYTSPHSNQQNRARNRFPLARRQGFLHAPPPFSTPPPLDPPATAERRPD
jgi:hypothetical protein